MPSARLGYLLAASVLILAACGYRQPAAGSGDTPSASATTSPSPTPEPTPLAIVGPTFQKGEVGLTYAPVTIQATGGTAPYAWTLGNGSLPGGLSISPAGVISGTPTAAGAFTFTIAVTDAGLATSNLSGAINIVPRLTAYHVGHMASNNEMEVCTEPGGNNPCPATDDRYLPFAAASGGAGPYTYSLVSGTLPAGTRLNGLALTGTFGTGIGVYTFTVAVTDSMGVTATINAIYNLYRLQPH